MLGSCCYAKLELDCKVIEEGVGLKDRDIMNTQRRRILYILLGIGIAALAVGLVFLVTYSG